MVAFLRNVAIIVIALILYIPNSYSNKIIDGRIDLTQTQWHNNLITLEGDADFYWQEFLLPNSPTDELVGHTKYKAPIPKPWTKVKLENNKQATAQGFGTYRIRIKLKNENEVYGLKLRSIFTAYKLYVNGNLLSSLGTIGESKSESKPKFLTQEIAIPIICNDTCEFQTLDVVLHVSNFHHKRAGAQQPMKFGTMNEIVDETTNTIILNMFLIGIILIIGLNHVLMYALRRLDIANLLFGFLSIIMILRNLSTEERLFLHWFPDMNWETLVRLDNFSGFATISLFALYFYFAYKKDFPKTMFIILTAIGAIVTVLVFTTKAWFYGQFRLIFEAYIGLGGLYLTFGVLMVAAIRKRQGALLSFIGMFLLYTTAINDVLSSMGLINSAFIAPYGIAAFMVLQSFLLTRKSAHALLDNQNLSSELSQEKQMLEKHIEERTSELSKQAEELKVYQKEQEQQNWINEGLNDITIVMRKNKDNLSELADGLLSTLVKKVDANLGAMYMHTIVNNEDQLKLLAQYGLKEEAQLEYIGTKEGLTGQCFSLAKEKFMNELPEKYFDISSGLGSATPRFLALLPLKIDELTIGVIEIASFKPINETSKNYLRRASENIASQLNIVKMNEESQKIIEESKKLEQEARAKNQEMRETIEEMQALQEEDEQKDNEINKLLKEAQEREKKVSKLLEDSYERQALFQEKLEDALEEIEELKKK